MGVCLVGIKHLQHIHYLQRLHPLKKFFVVVMWSQGIAFLFVVYDQ